MTNLHTDEKAMIDAHPFAQILSSQVNKSGFAELVYCPILLLENSIFNNSTLKNNTLQKGTLLGHLSNNNPLIKAVIENPKVKVIFTGPHGYISPRWHKEQVVPTWNYATVSLTCRLSFIENASDKLKAMEKMSHHFDPQWDFTEFNNVNNAKMVKQMLSAITVFTLDIIDVKSKFKLSQNRSVECRTSFQQNLEITGYSDLAKIQLL